MSVLFKSVSGYLLPYLSRPSDVLRRLQKACAYTLSGYGFTVFAQCGGNDENMSRWPCMIVAIGTRVHRFDGPSYRLRQHLKHSSTDVKVLRQCPVAL